MDLTRAQEPVTTFPQAVKQVSEIAQAKLAKPLHGALQRATALVLHRHVWMDEDGRHAQILAADGQTWFLANGNCLCLEAPKAQDGLCAHRLAVMIYRRASELLAAAHGTPAAASPAPLPEAPASANTHLLIEGHTVQVTLRDTDEDRLLTRLATLLQRYPAAARGGAGGEPAAQPTPEGWCLVHQVQMARQSNERGSWWSHKTADGWCRGKAPKA